jgi:hypothetical protein
VAKNNNDKAGPDESKLPGDETAADSDLFSGISDLEEMDLSGLLGAPTAESDLSGLLGAPTTEETPAEPAGDVFALDQTLALSETVPEQETPPPPPEAAPVAKKSAKLPGQYMEWGAAVVLLVALLAVASLRMILFSTAVYVILVGLVCYAIWKTRATNTVYTVILGCTLIAVITAVFCLLTELGRYDYDVKAQKAKQPFGMSQIERLQAPQRIV